MASLWDGDTGELILSVGILGYSVSSSAWSPDGRKLFLTVDGDENGTVLLYLRNDN